LQCEPDAPPAAIARLLPIPEAIGIAPVSTIARMMKSSVPGPPPAARTDPTLDDAGRPARPALRLSGERKSAFTAGTDFVPRTYSVDRAACERL